MAGRLNYHAYKTLIDEDVAWLKKVAPDTLERRHIIDVLNWSLSTLYADSGFRPFPTQAKGTEHDES